MLPVMNKIPQHQRYDVVIVGGAMIGSSIAWFTSNNQDFSGRILVVEKGRIAEEGSHEALMRLGGR